MKSRDTNALNMVGKSTPNPIKNDMITVAPAIGNIIAATALSAGLLRRSRNLGFFQYNSTKGTKANPNNVNAFVKFDGSIFTEPIRSPLKKKASAIIIADKTVMDNIICTDGGFNLDPVLAITYFTLAINDTFVLFLDPFFLTKNSTFSRLAIGMRPHPFYCELLGFGFCF